MSTFARLFFGVFLTLSLGARCSNIPIDTAMSAEDGREASLILCSKGECFKGYVFSQVEVGQATGNHLLELRAPRDYDCDLDACVRFQIFDLNGGQGYSGGIEKGETKAVFTLKDVIGSDLVSDEHDGEYAMKVKAWFKDNDGLNRSMISFAFIRINVLEPGYQALGCNDPAVAFTVDLKEECQAQYTTAFRSALCGEGCRGQ